MERINEDSGLMVIIGESPLKGKAISQARAFMARHPAPADGVPFDPAKHKLKMGRFKNPGRVINFQRRDNTMFKNIDKKGGYCNTDSRIMYRFPGI